MSVQMHSYQLALLTVLGTTVLCSCTTSPVRPLSNGKVLLQVSVEQKERLLDKLGYTNILFNGDVERDSFGTRLFVTVQTRPYPDQSTNTLDVASWLQRRTQLGQSASVVPTNQLVVVSAEGVHIAPWSRGGFATGDDEKVATAVRERDGTKIWQVRGERLPAGYYVMAVSGDWGVFGLRGRAPWIARLDAPTAAVVTLPASFTRISLYATGAVAHVFARRGPQLDEGPLKYLAYDLASGSPRLVKEMVLPWALCSLDMDPESGLAVLNDNSSFWGRAWLFDLTTGRRSRIPSVYCTRIVRSDVAQKWIELTKP